MFHHADGGCDGVDVVVCVVSILCERNVIIRRSGFVAEDDAVCDQNMVCGLCPVMDAAARHPGSVARNGGVHNVNAVTVSDGFYKQCPAAPGCTVPVEGGIVNIRVITAGGMEVNSTAVTGIGMRNRKQFLACRILDKR